MRNGAAVHMGDQCSVCEIQQGLHCYFNNLNVVQTIRFLSASYCYLGESLSREKGRKKEKTEKAKVEQKQKQKDP